MSALLNELMSWFEYIIFRLPGRIGSRLRSAYFSYRSENSSSRVGFFTGTYLEGMQNMTLSEGVAFGAGCMLYSETGKLIVGGNSKFNSGVILGADGGAINIGRDVLVGPNVVMRASNHCFKKSPRVPIVTQGHEYGKITIGNDVWIGANVTILAGTEVGNHCIIGAGAVVNGKIDSCSVAVGVPAKVIRKLNDSEGMQNEIE